jgi:hypothetical protein
MSSSKIKSSKVRKGSTSKTKVGASKKSKPGVSKRVPMKSKPKIVFVLCMTNTECAQQTDMTFADGWISRDQRDMPMKYWACIPP